MDTIVRYSVGELTPCSADTLPRYSLNSWLVPGHTDRGNLDDESQVTKENL